MIFSLHQANENRDGYNVSAASLKELPQVKCDSCGRCWGDGMINYSAFNFDQLEKSWSKKNVVTVSEFNILKKNTCNKLKREINIVPGSTYGVIEGNAYASLTQDFVWAQIFYPIIKKTAWEQFKTNGIELPIGMLNLKTRRNKSIDSYYALHIEPVQMIATKSLIEMKFNHCNFCGFSSSASNPKDDSTFYIKKNTWPKNRHLIILPETMDIVVSEQFRAISEKLKIAGIKFEPKYDFEY